ncbi:TrmB family transcriptional regulator [Candidatus Woesearchaeota archaeon]|nr:TrmB family transcriptional regulator [Candidatus Woesearchaeota archaeon]
MAIKKSTIEKLKNTVNLNIYETKIYTSLLSRGISSAGELAEISGVPRSRCYDVLETLEKKGFVFMKIGKPIKYISIPPEEVLETLKKQARIEEKRMIALFDEFQNTEVFKELKSLYDTGITYINNDQISTALVGKHNINLFLKEMFTGASDSIVIHTTKEGMKRKSKILKKASPKVPITIHAPVDSQKMKNIAFVKASPKMRCVAADDQLLIFTSQHDVTPDKEIALWFKSSFAAETIRNFMK